MPWPMCEMMSMWWKKSYVERAQIWRQQRHAYLVEFAPEPTIPFGTVVPFLVDDPESDILIRWPGYETNEATVVLASRRKTLASFSAVFPFNLKGWGFGGVNQVRVEDIELVALYHFRRWIVMIVVGLVVFVPFVSELHSIEITRFSGFVLVSPRWSPKCKALFGSKGFLILAETTSCFALVQRTCARSLVIVDGDLPLSR